MTSDYGYWQAPAPRPKCPICDGHMIISVVYSDGVWTWKCDQNHMAQTRRP